MEPSKTEVGIQTLNNTAVLNLSGKVINHDSHRQLEALDHYNKFFQDDLSYSNHKLAADDMPFKYQQDSSNKYNH